MLTFVLWIMLVPIGASQGKLCNYGSYLAIYALLPLLFFASLALILALVYRGEQNKKWLGLCVIVGFVCFAVVMNARGFVC